MIGALFVAVASFSAQAQQGMVQMDRPRKMDHRTQIAGVGNPLGPE